MYFEDVFQILAFSILPDSGLEHIFLLCTGMWPLHTAECKLPELSGDPVGDTVTVTEEPNPESSLDPFEWLKEKKNYSEMQIKKIITNNLQEKYIFQPFKK